MTHPPTILHEASVLDAVRDMIRASPIPGLRTRMLNATGPLIEVRWEPSPGMEASLRVRMVPLSSTRVRLLVAVGWDSVCAVNPSIREAELHILFYQRVIALAKEIEAFVADCEIESMT